jgi:hypothetical protein
MQGSKSSRGVGDWEGRSPNVTRPTSAGGNLAEVARRESVPVQMRADWWAVRYKLGPQYLHSCTAPQPMRPPESAWEPGRQWMRLAPGRPTWAGRMLCDVVDLLPVGSQLLAVSGLRLDSAQHRNPCSQSQHVSQHISTGKWAKEHNLLGRQVCYLFQHLESGLAALTVPGSLPSWS